MARYFQQNLGFLRDFGHQTWFGPRTHATSNGLRKTLAETLGWRSSCIVWMTCPSWIVTIVDFDDFRPTQFLDFFLFFPMYSYIFFEIMDDIIYIYSSCWAHRFMPRHFGEQLATDNKNTEAWKQMKNSWICRWFLNWWMCFFPLGNLLEIRFTFYWHP